MATVLMEALPSRAGQRGCLESPSCLVGDVLARSVFPLSGPSGKGRLSQGLVGLEAPTLGRCPSPSGALGAVLGGPCPRGTDEEVEARASHSGEEVNRVPAGIGLSRRDVVGGFGVTGPMDQRGGWAPAASEPLSVPPPAVGLAPASCSCLVFRTGSWCRLCGTGPLPREGPWEGWRDSRGGW